MALKVHVRPFIEWNVYHSITTNIDGLTLVNILLKSLRVLTILVFFRSKTWFWNLRLPFLQKKLHSNWRLQFIIWIVNSNLLADLFLYYMQQKECNIFGTLTKTTYRKLVVLHFISINENNIVTLMLPNRFYVYVFIRSAQNPNL